MQEFEKQKSTVKLTVDKGSGPKKAPLGAPPRKDGRRFVEEFIAPAMKQLEDAQKAVPAGTRPAQGLVGNGDAKKAVKKLGAMRTSSPVCADFKAKKPSVDHLKPKVRPTNDSRIGSKIINTLVILSILVGLAFAGKIGYEQYTASRRIGEIKAIREKIEDTELKYKRDSSNLAAAYASISCGAIATSIEKMQASCSHGNCSLEEKVELGKVIDQFNDFCSTVGPHKISKFGEPPVPK